MFATRKIASMTAMVGSFLALAAGPAFAEGAVKVECWGNCGNVNLGQVCDKYSAGSNPVAIACDDTASPGSGWSSACGGSTCVAYGGLVRTDALSAYCVDGGGNDVVVTCR
jgi:hypothetical protein